MESNEEGNSLLTSAYNIKLDGMNYDQVFRYASIFTPMAFPINSPIFKPLQPLVGHMLLLELT